MMARLAIRFILYFTIMFGFFYAYLPLALVWLVVGMFVVFDKEDRKVLKEIFGGD